MSRQRGIVGFETGRDDTGYTVTANGVVSTGSARTGQYKFRDQRTVAGITGSAAITVTPTVGSGELFFIGTRIFVCPLVFPSANNYQFIKVSDLGITVQADTSGHVRLAPILETAHSYSTDPMVIGNWYSYELKFYGLNKTGAVTNSGRMLVILEVYDYGASGEEDPTLLYSTITSGQVTNVQANINCIGGVFVAVGEALQTNSAHISNLRLMVSGATPNGCLETGAGSYPTITSETTATGPACAACGPVTNGNVIEAGGLNGLDVQDFLKSSSAITSLTITVGQTGSGVSCTRDFLFDDVYWDAQTASDVPDAFETEFPESTFVQPFPIVGQGAFDQFTPAGSFGSIDQIPMDDSGSITASTSAFKTSYVHDALDPSGIVEHIRVYARWLGSVLTQNLIIFDDALDIQTTTASVAAAVSNVVGDFPFEGNDNFIDSDTFNATEYGVNILNAGTVTIRGLFIEVLTGEADIILIPGGGGNIEGGLDLGDLGITSDNLVLITDGSGIYSITANQFFDELYARNNDEDTVEVAIPDPFFETFYAGDE